MGLRSERGPVLGAVMLSTALIALDSTIIATAVPSIVGDLGGFSQFPWLFSVYLLATRHLPSATVEVAKSSRKSPPSHGIPMATG